ncbi:hypothetical protein F5887DRAFT_281765 [Amanita rubescens]|nr:hypothetical protein F5887DRAFT_114516 [Amanita rubescens]KAF8343658.1 hypothetical protein F5887DRAFT_281765 [Amanita rubescens]
MPLSILHCPLLMLFFSSFLFFILGTSVVASPVSVSPRNMDGYWHRNMKLPDRVIYIKGDQILNTIPEMKNPDALPVNTNWQRATRISVLNLNLPENIRNDIPDVAPDDWIQLKAILKEPGILKYEADFRLAKAPLRDTHHVTLTNAIKASDKSSEPTHGTRSGPVSPPTLDGYWHRNMKNPDHVLYIKDLKLLNVIPEPKNAAAVSKSTNWQRATRLSVLNLNLPEDIKRKIPDVVTDDWFQIRETDCGPGCFDVYFKPAGSNLQRLKLENAIKGSVSHRPGSSSGKPK